MEIADFLDVERKYKLNELSYNGVNYWNYNRFVLWNYSICSENLKLGKAHNKHSFTLIKAIKLICYYSFSLHIFRKHEMIVLNHPRRLFDGKKYECIYTDDLVDGRYDAQFLEAPYQHSHFRPTISKKISYLDRIIINSEIKLKLFKLFRKKSYNKMLNEIETKIKQPIDELKEIYHWSEDTFRIAKILTDTVIRCQYEKKKYRKIVECIQPKVIVEVVYYNRYCMLFNEIAKEMKIPTIELQHGTMYGEHIAYQYAQNMEIPQLPDKIFLFSDFWKQFLNLPIEDSELVVTGYPHFEKRIREYKRNNKLDNRKTIVFISQGTIGQYLSKLARELSERLSSEEYRLIYKLHPSEYGSWKKEMACLDIASIEVIDDKNVDLYDIFSQSDVQIGVYSTAIFEGVGFGLQTYIYNVGHYDIMLPLIKQGYAKLITSADDFVFQFENNDFVPIEVDTFWKSNAKINICNEIDKVISQKRS